MRKRQSFLVGKKMNIENVITATEGGKGDKNQANKSLAN